MIYTLFLLVTMALTLGAQGYINSMYNKTKKISLNRTISGSEVARKILDENGLKNVKVVEVEGTLTDHYDPRNKTVSLSKDIYHNTSVASCSVAAHECGHAIQDKEGYSFLRFRNSIIPVVNLASRAGYFIIMISLFTSLIRLLWLGILMELVILLFQVVTLPVEFNASNRALKQLITLNLVTDKEHASCKKMLTAAALTYVAAVAAAILEILRLVMIANRDRS